MAAEHDAIVEQFRDLVDNCKDVACAEAHIARYEAQLRAAEEQQRVHREYLDCVIVRVIEMFRKRAEDLKNECHD